MKLGAFPFVRPLFFITAIVLVIFSIGSFMRVNGNPDMKNAYIIYAVLMAGDAIAMLVCGLYVNRQMKAIFWFAVIVLILNIVLIIFDQFGWVDLLFSLLNAITLATLLVFRKEFLSQ